MSRTTKRIFAIALMAYAVSVGAVTTQSASDQSNPDPALLRICGDPDNLPYSNEKLEGFENKIAAVIASELKLTPTYTWWPHQRGMVRNTLDAGTCDVVFGVPQELELLMTTKPYYSSSYVIAYRKNSSYKITSLDAPELKTLKIGAYTNTSVEESLARRGLLNNVTRYSLFFDPLGDRDRPTKLITDLVDGTIDVALPWGPIAGYYAKKLNAPIELVPVPAETGVPEVFAISMGIKRGNKELRARLEAAMDARQADIRGILAEYGVPQVAQQPAQPAVDPAAPAPAAPAQDAAPVPDAAPAGTGSTTKNPYTGNAEMAAEGRALYFKIGCQGCHGGAGGGGMATSVIDESWKFGGTDEILYKLIKGQIPEQTMPTVYSKLSDEEVWKLLAFIRASYKGDPGAITW
jgi:mxaJ protein